MNNEIKSWKAKATWIVATNLCLPCCIPQDGICLALDPTAKKEMVRDFVDQAQNPNADTFQQQLVNLVQVLEDSEDPIAEAYQLLCLLIDHMNTRYGTALTMSQLFQLIRENPHLIQIPGIEEADLLEGLEMLEQYEEDLAKETSRHGRQQQRLYKNPPQKKKKKHAWEKVAVTLIITGGALALACIHPVVIPVIIEGAVAIGRIAFDKKN